ncbi:deoxyribodipyrimidine photo-lyase [Candidatus Nephthysia bennettiae]|uniref:cryptochrome/photolyase family protein n=1 Tax=Candidatus Nephthysia bennettiae TaxID=3127016 RepID=UPI0030C66DDE
MDVGVVLFTRDLRVHDHPALAAAARSFDSVLPLFVYDGAILGGPHAAPNRLRFLEQSLQDLNRSLRGTLVRRSGETAEEAIRAAREVEAGAIFMSADVSAFAQRRERQMSAACADAGIQLRTFPGVTVVPSGSLHPTGGDHFRVFTPYLRAWANARWRKPEPPVERLKTVSGLRSAPPPLPAASVSPDLVEGGETAGRARMDLWLASSLRDYALRRDELAADATSRLSPYLHFGCVSPLELALRAQELGGDDFVRQLCWRDFHHQVTSAFPSLSWQDYRRERRWRHDDVALEAWKRGRTGIPVVDAGMRQLQREGWMHNRARLLVASHLTRREEIDWRDGASHFLDLLLDGDIANNSGNWQWVAGTGNDTRPNRVFNPLRQAEHFDPDGDYVRRYVPELAGITGPAVHQPWKLEPGVRRRLDYPQPALAGAVGGGLPPG